MWSQVFFPTMLWGKRIKFHRRRQAFKYRRGGWKSHIASESETRQSHFFILKANSCSETSRLNHFLPAQKFSECASTHTHLYTHMVRRTKKRSTKKNNSLMMSFAISEHSYMFHVTWFPAKITFMSPGNSLKPGGKGLYCT